MQPALEQPLRNVVTLRQLSDWYATAVWLEATKAHPPVETRPKSHRATPSRGQRGNAEIEACIIARENGGDYGRSSNPSHFGRYQFSRQLWEAAGGDPSEWGYASPEEQDRVFRNAVSQYGYAPWRPYDGC